MINLKDFIIKEIPRKTPRYTGETNKRKLFKYSCFKCNKDRGYLRKNSSDICKKCSHTIKNIKITNIRYLQCPICNTKFNTIKYNKKYCTDKCKKKNTRNKRRATKQGKLKHRVSSLVSTRLRNQGLNKNNKSTFDILSYTLEELISHLESQFEDWMTWDNYGLKGWTIDHIKSESSFVYSNIEDKEFIECWALSNLRPLKHSGKNGNASKGNKSLCDIIINVTI